MLLGKFMPLHRGHMHLIDTARAEVDRLTVLVCTLRSEPIAGDLRYAWVRECYPGLRVIHHTDEIPSAPEEHPDFWAIWTWSIRRFFPEGGPDLVFTSETYGDRLAAVLGARHRLVDLARATVPISATLVRADPRAHWDMIPPCVQRYYADLEKAAG